MSLRFSTFSPGAPKHLPHFLTFFNIFTLGPKTFPICLYVFQHFHPEPQNISHLSLRFPTFSPWAPKHFLYVLTFFNIAYFLERCPYAFQHFHLGPPKMFTRSHMPLCFIFSEHSHVFQKLHPGPKLVPFTFIWAALCIECCGREGGSRRKGFMGGK